MHPSRLLVPLALLPVFACAQTTVFHTNFDSDSLNQASFTPTSTTTSWNIASSKNATSGLGTGDLVLSIPATTSGFVEAQTVFSSTPVTLSNTNDSITLTVTFKATTNILASGTGSQIFLGLFDSGGVVPLNTLQSSGLSTTQSSAKATGGTQLWQGYNSRIAFDGGSSAILTRAQQNATDTSTGAGSTSANQDLLFQGGGGAYVNPAAASLVTSNNTAATAALTAGNTYTMQLDISRVDASTLSISNNLYDGTGVGGTNLATISFASLTGTNLLTSQFSGLAIGYRYSSTSAASSITFTDLSVVYTSAVPEPATYAAFAGLAGLGLAIRRRGRAS